jgi:Flp pilus assembly protein TadD
MKRLFVSSVAVLALWAGTANAGWFDSDTPAVPEAVKLTNPQAQSQPAQQAPQSAVNQPAGDTQDMADLIKNLPSNLDGEIKRAELLRAHGNYQEAAKSLSQIMIVAPDDPRVVGDFGKVMVQEGRSKDAEEFLKRAIELQPGDWTFYSALGIAYDQLDDRAHAKAAYEHALALKPGDAVVLNNYAVSRMLAGDYPAAQRLLAQAQLSGGDYPKIVNNVAMLANMSPAPVHPYVAQTTVTTTTTTTIAGTAPRPLQGGPKVGVSVASLPAATPTVVMQKVPSDPLAGPVATAAPQKLVKMQPVVHRKPKPALASKDVPSAPTLRTAAQTN